ncbi:hypothetical protein OB905_08445 [Halobacteria archaeon AArc-dxtr1]|nr:hypothetical protein [Halobacteria archaeon AArc-dxtr1]
MSTDGRTETAAGSDAVPVLDHPWIGLERRRTLLTLGYVAVLVALFAVSYLGTTVTVDGATLDTLTPRFDTVSTVLILLATLTITVAPLVYAGWNGGPVTAFALALVPVVLAELAAGRYILGLDAVVALTVGAAASVVAVYATGVRRTGALLPWRRAVPDLDTLLFVTVISIVSAVAAARFVLAVPSYMAEWYAPFGALWLVTAGLLGVYWYAWARLGTAERSEEGVIDA